MALDLADTSLADLLAPVWLVSCWLGYAYYAEGERPRRNLTRVMNTYRIVWARQMLERGGVRLDVGIPNANGSWRESFSGRPRRAVLAQCRA